MKIAMLCIPMQTEGGPVACGCWFADTQPAAALHRSFPSNIKSVTSASLLTWLSPVQKSDLARMYRLFQRIPKGLEPVADSFKKHVESEGMKLVKEATEAASAKKDKDAGKPSKDSGA